MSTGDRTSTSRTAFYVDARPQPLWSPSMTYTEARRWLRAQLGSTKGDLVIVRVGS